MQILNQELRRDHTPKRNHIVSILISLSRCCHVKSQDASHHTHSIKQDQEIVNIFQIKRTCDNDCPIPSNQINLRILEAMIIEAAELIKFNLKYNHNSQASTIFLNKILVRGQGQELIVSRPNNGLHIIHQYVRSMHRLIFRSVKRDGSKQYNNRPQSKFYTIV